MTFATDGGIEWEKDETNKVLTIRPSAYPASGYTSGQMKNYEQQYGGTTAPWGAIQSGQWTLVLEEGLTNIGNNAFLNSIALTGPLTIPSTVTSIGNVAFYYCTRLTGPLTIPSAVTNIGSQAFSNCSGFTGNLTIGNGVTNIGDQAFTMCNGFNGTLTIGSAVTNIGGWAFYDCNGFTEVKFLGNKPAFGSSAMALDNRSGSTQTYDCYSIDKWAESAMTRAVSANTRWNFLELETKTMMVKVDGAWKQGVPFVKVDGAWKQGTPFVKTGGVWI